MDQSSPDRRGDRRRRLRQIADSRPDALFGRSDEHGVKGWLGRTDSYGFVLITLMAFVWVFIPLAAEERWARIPAVTVFYLTIVVALHTSYVRLTTLRAAIAVNTVLLLATVIGFSFEVDRLQAASDLGYAVLLFVTALVILRRILAHTTVTSRTVSGGVAAWLFVAVAFASLYAGIDVLDPDAFNVSTEQGGFGPMLYFSLVTVATLGYGDIVPVSSLARSAATLEAVMGQIYLITVVARMVSLLGTRRITDEVDPATGDEPPA